MSTIKRLARLQAIVCFPDFDIRIFVRYRGRYCSAIRIWKLPPRSSLLSMIKSDRLIWAIYGDAAKFLHGWFYQEGPNLIDALAGRIVKCRDFEEVKAVLIDFEGIMQGKLPSSGPMSPFGNIPTE